MCLLVLKLSDFPIPVCSTQAFASTYGHTIQTDIRYIYISKKLNNAPIYAKNNKWINQSIKTGTEEMQSKHQYQNIREAELTQ